MVSSSTVSFTAPRVAAFKCEEGKQEQFFWDVKARGLGCRVQSNGTRSYVFQSRFAGKLVRMSIGRVGDWTLEAARNKAGDLQKEINEGRDPRVLKAEKIAADVAKREATQAEVEAGRVAQVTFGEAWAEYVAVGGTTKPWRANTLRDHQKVARPGGEVRRNGREGLTQPGILAEFLATPLADLTEEALTDWARRQAHRKTSARRAVRMLKTFLKWAARDRSPYRSVVHEAAASGDEIGLLLGESQAKEDSLQREQLATWFRYVTQIGNPVASAYLQGLLLTGARREELGKLRWADVDFRWQSLRLGDKVEEYRTIPLTPYLAHLLQALPRRNEWVFSSPASASGRMTEPSIAHRKACAAAGLSLTLHGLRRSFANLSEWLELPTGVVYQIMGHRPSATAEKHYRRRPLDLLRVHHAALEAFILREGQVSFAALGSTNVRLIHSAE